MYKYLFYSIYKGYRNFEEGDMAGLYAASIITLLQWLPVYSIIMILYKLKLSNYSVEKGIGLISLMALLGINCIYYLSNGNKSKIIKKIESLDKNKLRIVKAIAIVYSIFAFFLFVTVLGI